MRWKTLSSRVIVDDQWLRLSADRCRRPNGTTIEPYYRIYGKDWVNVCPIFPDGTLVLVREYRHGYGDVLLGLPGGLIDAEDATPAIAAQRELHEETGIRRIFSLVQTGSMIVNPSTNTNVGHSFLALCDPDGRDDIGTAEPDIRLVSLDFIDTLQQVIFGEALFSGYDVASLLRALFTVCASDERRFETLRRRAAAVFQQPAGLAKFTTR